MSKRETAAQRTLVIPGFDVSAQPDASAPSLGLVPTFKRQAFIAPGTQPMDQRLSTHIADDEWLPLCREPGLKPAEAPGATRTCQECPQRASKLRAIVR